MTAVEELDQERMPRHVAVIMDGNGRWAEERGKSHVEGHEAGAGSVRRIIEGCRELGIPMLSLYAFSTENWSRGEEEVSALFRLMSTYIHRELDELDRNDIRICFMGRWSGLPERAAADLRECVARTAQNDALVLNVGINYGGRAEIVDACQRIGIEAAAGALDVSGLDEDTIATYLYLPHARDVDLLIRTSGEMRVSNFMLWQIAYAELVVLPVLWPDFTKEHLVSAIAAFQQRRRRFGGRP